MNDEYDRVTWGVLIGEMTMVKGLVMGEQGEWNDRVMIHDP
jgi:hypothetical protein